MYVILGCTDSSATNYISTANTDDGSCRYDVHGCTAPSALNFDSLATVLLAGSCEYKVEGRATHRAQLPVRSVHRAPLKSLH